MRHTKTCVFMSLFLMQVLFLNGCSRPSGKSIVLARIGDTEITLADFNERIASLPPRYVDIVKKRKKEFLDEIINDTLLYQEALRTGLDKDKDVQKVIEQARQKILIARLLKDRVDDEIEITDEEVIEYYNGNESLYMTPEIMRVSHILVPKQEDAEAILSELMKGASFDDLARAKSVDPTAQRGGDIGYFPEGQLMPKFEDACAQLEIGEISGVVKTKLGYHVIMLTDRRKPELRPLEQVEDDIRSRLRAVERQKLFNGMLGDLKDKTRIEVDQKVLSDGR